MGIREEVQGPASIKKALLGAATGLYCPDWELAAEVQDCLAEDLVRN